WGRKRRHWNSKQKKPAKQAGFFIVALRSGAASRARCDRLVVVGDGHLHATVLRTAGIAGIVRNRILLAVALSDDTRRLHAGTNQCATYRFGATLGQTLVVAGRADTVGVTLDDHLALRIFLEETCQLRDVG